MNIVIQEDSRAPIFTEKAKKSFPKNSIIKIYPRIEKSSLDILKSPPLLSNKWLVLVDVRVPIKIIETLAGNENCINIIYANNKDYKLKVGLCKKFSETSYVNMLNVVEDEAIKYIQERLNVSVDLAKFLAKRCKLYMPYIEESLVILSSIDRALTKKDIESYVEFRSNVNPSRLYYHYLGIKHIGKKELVEYLYSFRFALTYLKKELLKMLDTTLELYKLIDDGVIGENNIEDYCLENRLPISAYMAKVIVTEIHPILSYSDIILKRILLIKTENILTFTNLFI